jgi:hypothetical protein
MKLLAVIAICLRGSGVQQPSKEDSNGRTGSRRQ